VFGQRALEVFEVDIRAADCRRRIRVQPSNLIDARFADTDISRPPALAKELITDNVDIIVTASL
jgi:hypothetical protein